MCVCAVRCHFFLVENWMKNIFKVENVVVYKIFNQEICNMLQFSSGTRWSKLRSSRMLAYKWDFTHIHKLLQRYVLSWLLGFMSEWHMVMLMSKKGEFFHLWFRSGAVNHPALSFRRLLHNLKEMPKYSTLFSFKITWTLMQKYHQISF